MINAMALFIKFSSLMGIKLELLLKNKDDFLKWIAPLFDSGFDKQATINAINALPDCYFEKLGIAERKKEFCKAVYVLIRDCWNDFK